MPRKKKEKPVLDLEIFTKTGKLRKRKPKKQITYFTQETEDAIIKYVKSTDQTERNYLFDKYINFSLHKLAENIIHTYKYYYTDVDNIEDLKHEVVYDLLERLHLYDQSKGRAYSYFGTIARRYLIRYNAVNYKKKKDRKELEDVDEDRTIVNSVRNESLAVDLSHFVQSYLTYVKINIDKLFKKEKEKDIVYAIMSLFDNMETLADMNILNKQVVYLQIRERTDQPTQAITKVVRQMKIIMTQQMNIYYRAGALEIPVDDIYN